MEVALRHLDDLLYCTFCLRSRVTEANESVCRDPYTQLLDHLRDVMALHFDLTSASQDLIEFLLGLDLLQTRDHLIQLFKFCCLSSTSPSPTYPDDTVGIITTTGHQSRFTDVILPCPSYMAGPVTICSVDSNSKKFSLPSASFGRTAFPLLAIHGHMLLTLEYLKSQVTAVLLSHRISRSKEVCVRSEEEDYAIDEFALKPPSNSKRKRMEKSASRSSSSSVVGESAHGASNF